MQSQRRQSRSTLVPLFGTAVLFGGANAALAVDYSWIPTATGSTYSWINASNWSSAGGTFPATASDTATLSVDLAGDQTISLNQAITISALTLGDTSSTSNSVEYTIASGTGGNPLTFQSATAGGATALTVSGGGANTPTHVFSAPVSLGGTSSLTISIVGTQNATFSGGINIGSNTLTISGDGTGSVTFGGQITGDGRLVKNSAGAATIGTTVKSFTGTYVFNRGSLSLNDGSMKNSAEIIINGALSGGVTQAGASVNEGNNNAQTVNPGQRLTSNKLTMNGGTLSDAGQLSNGTWGTTVIDSLAELSIHSGYNFISFGKGGSTAGTELHATTLSRGEGASLYVRALIQTGVNGLNSDLKLTADNGSALLVGGGTDTGTERRIIPWLVARTTNAATSTPESFATYDSNGVRMLDTTTEYATSVTAGQFKNVTSGTFSLVSDAEIGSLRYNTSGASNMGTGRTLTVNTGAVMFLSNSGAIGSTGSVSAGTLAFGSAEAVVYVLGSNTNTIGAAITGTKGLTKATTGTLVLTGNNSGLKGAVNVGAGTLAVNGNSGATSALSGIDYVRVHAGATLELQVDDVIRDAADLKLDQYGLLNGKINVLSDVNDTISALFINGVAVTPDIYSSSNMGLLSGFVTFGNSGSSLTVTATPEPSTLSLLAVGGLGLLKRRRRA